MVQGRGKRAREFRNVLEYVKSNPSFIVLKMGRVNSTIMLSLESGPRSFTTERALDLHPGRQRGLRKSVGAAI